MASFTSSSFSRQPVAKSLCRINEAKFSFQSPFRVICLNSQKLHYFQQSMPSFPCHAIHCCMSLLERYTKLLWSCDSLRLSLVNYSKHMQSFLLNFGFQCFPQSIAGPLLSKQLAVVRTMVWGVTKHLSVQSGVRVLWGSKKVKEH